ncbi:MAG: hypothetical protein KIS94_08865 [Chitinophagales bacterium]|nr:hypothetical protein [Chitinophagales bacterium]
MKAKTILTLSLGLILAFVCGNLGAQTAPAGTETSLTAGPQSVANNVVTNPNVLVVTGKIIDAQTRKPIPNAKINFDKFGEELLQASIDDKGNYALALNKKELGEPIRVIFRVAGYKRFVVKSLDKSASYVDVDVYLQPMESEEKSNGKVTYKMDDNPFNPLVIKMQ